MPGGRRVVKASIKMEGINREGGGVYPLLSVLSIFRPFTLPGQQLKERVTMYSIFICAAHGRQMTVEEIGNGENRESQRTRTNGIFHYLLHSVDLHFAFLFSP